MEILFEQIAAYSVAIILCLIVVFIYLRKQRRESKQVEEKIVQAKLDGMYEPVSLHPVIDEGSCIRTGACIAACPEKDILGIRNGKATTINASHCVGHGACFHACPTQAITLCIGTEKRGVELPHVNQNFETNVPGIFIAGELGGMGLIKNAVEQGKQAVDNIVKYLGKNQKAAYDLIIVGAGPAGIAASLSAKKHNLKFLTLEQDTLGGTVFTFPRSKIVMTSPMDVPLHGKIKLSETSKSELIEFWTSVLSKNAISIKENSKVEAIIPENGCFKLETTTGEIITSSAVLLAIGRRGTPRKLGIPGEMMEKVAYRLIEAEEIHGKDILVVGGGDSAIESALLLAGQNKVTLTYRSDVFSRLKPKNSEKIKEAISKRQLEVMFNSSPVKIDKDSVVISQGTEQKELVIKNDLVYIFAGGELPTQFLQKIGIHITKKFGDAVLKHISFLALVFVVCLKGYSQISPGELSKVHSHLEGISNCTKCHILGKKVSNQKCLDCHTELKSRIDAQKGFHASSTIKGKECVTCHSDHHGLNFQIIRFEKEKFNHDLAGFKLTGAHLKKKCIDCHKPEHITDQKIKKKKFTYLGLNPACLTCHADYHQKTLPATCSDCHNDEAFKPAIKFDHARVKFKLAGKHQGVLCISCHKVTTLNGQKFQEFRGIKFDNCSSCHKDVHNNKFGPNCSQCHSEQSFSVIKGVQNFDHNKTDFKLEGKHQKVTCISCHKTKLTNALKYANCSDCHKDYHNNQFARQGVSPDCSQCHTVNGFSEFTYTIEQHNAGVFQLKGAHLATPCFACHKKQVSVTDTSWHFKDIGKQCVDCHKDIHQTFISEKYYPEANCKNCHSENKWNSVSFDHSKTNFGLTGAHAKKTCRDCHFRKTNGVANQQFKGTSATCTGCHTDVHAKQFEINGVSDCTRCHDTEKFKPASKFDHSKTLFPLDGKHLNVACIKCHKVKQDKEIAFVLYKIKEFKCENCHH